MPYALAEQRAGLQEIRAAGVVVDSAKGKKATRHGEGRAALAFPQCLDGFDHTRQASWPG